MLYFVLNFIYECMFDVWRNYCFVVFWDVLDVILFGDFWLRGFWLWFKMEFLRDLILFEGIFFLLFIVGRIEK